MPKKAVVMMTLFLLILVEIAIAVPKTKPPKPDKPRKEITFTESASLGLGNINLGQQMIDAGILYVQDAISTGTISSGDSPISGFEILTSLSGALDLSTYLGSYDGKWIIIGQSGGFEGSIVGEVAVATISGKFVGQGTGDFEDHKIKGTFEGSVNNFQIEITIQATISYTEK
ncbi:MAG: hypothetical protein JSV51_06260 [Candidatus Bathyarchaeota archaeon]|nr:MAG: hypothetical protein JSV51_06260 [Candidatus Bathyarchaeota archaeon]